jgi:hypothetical protein
MHPLTRKPIKKRTQRSHLKVISKAWRPNALKRRVKQVAKTEAEKDPFYIDPKLIPKGQSYQWVTNAKPEKYQIHSMMDLCLASGWRPVKGKKFVGGQTLMWAPKAIADAQRDVNTNRAQDQLRQFREMFGMEKPEAGGINYFSAGHIVSEPYQNIPQNAPPIDCDVTVKFRLSQRYQDAAAALHLDPQVYAQRRLALYLRGEIGGILLPVGGALELFEGGNFSIQEFTRFNG